MADVRESSLAKRRLRLTLGLFLVALVVPTGVLVYHAYGQLKSEAFYQYRVLAEELANRIDARVRALMATEEGRSSSDYRFLVLQGDAHANFLQRSPLSTFPVDASIPGLVAFFQIDAAGAFSTPLLPVDADPAAYGVTAGEAQRRRALEQTVRALLANAPDPSAAQSNERRAAIGTANARAVAAESDTASFALPARSFRLAASDAKAKANEQRQDKDTSGQAVFDRLSEPEPAADDTSANAPANAFAKKALPAAPRAARKEQTIVPEMQGGAVGSVASDRVRTFEGELDPFVFRRLNASHFVLFRKVWLDGQRLIQGAVIEQRRFVDDLVVKPFRETALSQVSSIGVAYRGEGIDAQAAASVDSAQRNEDLLYRTTLPAPLGDVELVFGIARLPLGPGGQVIGWATLVLAIVLCGGLVAVYRFGVAQIDLNRQQQDFVSAVSHELKTPLTSIRMYGEILKAGWASEEKKKTYYDFIFYESERLSRLIANVLRLARLTRNGDSLDLKNVAVTELLDLVESKVLSQVEQAGFKLTLVRDPAALERCVMVDADSFVQVLINLVDNALKFSAHASDKTVEIGCRHDVHRDGVEFWVRDFGSGIAPQHLPKIFELFYRAEDELTRETAGTGIGLALVNELTSAMGGNVVVRNCDPGARFAVLFPVVSQPPRAMSDQSNRRLLLANIR